MELCLEEPYREQWTDLQALLDLAPYWTDREESL
jgi:hypothetical protein